MKIRITIISVLFFCGYLVSKAQVPGYIGKRWAVQVGNGVGGAFSGDFSVQGLSLPRFTNTHNFYSFSFHPSIAVAFTVKKRMDVGIRVGTLKLEGLLPNNYDFYGLEYRSMDGVENEFPDEFPESLVPIFESTYRMYQYELINPKNTGKSFDFQFFVRFYNHKYIAPVGLYHQVGIGYNFFWFENNKIAGVFTGSDIPNTPDTIVLSRQKQLSLSYMFGRKRTFGNGFFLDLGIEFNLFYHAKKNRYKKLSFFGFDAAYTDSFHTIEYSYHHYLPNILADEIRRNRFFEFKFGFGKIF